MKTLSTLVAELDEALMTELFDPRNETNGPWLAWLTNARCRLSQIRPQSGTLNFANFNVAAPVGEDVDLDLAFAADYEAMLDADYDGSDYEAAALDMVFTIDHDGSDCEAALEVIEF
jgi:hypothetical protein